MLRLFGLVTLLGLFAFQPANAFGNADGRDGKFYAIAMLVSDKDWKEKWYSATDGGLKFEGSDKISLGEELNLLVGFANAATDEDGRIDIRCDLEITQPDGSSAASLENGVCAPENLANPSSKIIPSYLTVRIVAEQDEPIGEMLFKIVVRDAVAGRQVALELTLTGVAP
jgi:hypothetical protein